VEIRPVFRRKTTSPSIQCNRARLPAKELCLAKMSNMTRSASVRASGATVTHTPRNCCERPLEMAVSGRVRCRHRHRKPDSSAKTGSLWAETGETAEA